MNNDDGMTDGPLAGMEEAPPTVDNDRIDPATAPAGPGGQAASPAVARAIAPDPDKSLAPAVAALASLAGPLAAIAASIAEIVGAFSRPRAADIPGVEAGPAGPVGAEVGKALGEGPDRDPDRSGGEASVVWTPAGREDPLSLSGPNSFDSPRPGDTATGEGHNDRDTDSDSVGPGASPGWGGLAEYQDQTEAALAAAAQRAAQQARSAEALAALLDQLAEADARLEAKIDQLASQVANRR